MLNLNAYIPFLTKLTSMNRNYVKQFTYIYKKNHTKLVYGTIIEFYYLNKINIAKFLGLIYLSNEQRYFIFFINNNC